MPHMPVVGKGFEESLDDRSLSWESEGLQVEPQGLVDTEPLEAECAAKRIDFIRTSNILPQALFTIDIKHSDVSWELKHRHPINPRTNGSHALNCPLLYKAVQELHVLAIADKLADHLFVQSRVFSEPLGHLVVVYGVTEKTFLLEELDPFLGLLVELLCACDQ